MFQVRESACARACTHAYVRERERGRVEGTVADRERKSVHNEV